MSTSSDRDPVLQEQHASPAELSGGKPRPGAKNGPRRRRTEEPRVHAGRRVAAPLLACLTLLAISPMRVGSPPSHIEGAYATESVLAEVPFEVEDLAATENARRRAANAAPYVYRVDPTMVSERLDVLAHMLHQIEQIALKDVLSAEERRRLAAISVRPTLSEATIGLLIQPENLAAIRAQTLALASAELDGGIFDDQPLLATRVKLVRADGTHVIRPREDVPRVASAMDRLEAACRREAGDNAVLASTLFEVARVALGSTVRFDEVATQTLQTAARTSTPPVLRTIHRNEVIVQAGHQVTLQDVAELTAYSRVIHHGGQLTTYVGNALIVVTLIVGGVVFLRSVRPDVLASGRLVWLVTGTVLVIVGTARALVEAGVATEYRVLVPVAAGAIILAVLLDRLVGVGIALFAALAVATMPEYGTEFLLQALVSTLFGVIVLGRVRKRSDLLRPSLAVGLACGLMTLAHGLTQEAGLQAVAVAAGIGCGNGLIILVVPSLLTPLERLARVTTDISLLEYCDLKHPLLVRMQQEAPGTFHHSLTMATLSEAAAEAIGANPLLARVGCYFHDIGKMVKPEYFSENQHGVNAHDRITPRMSALILTAHVKEGIALGREHGLTEPILAFIPEHQGAAIMVHFYKKALEQAGDGETVDEVDFRYPGPRPQSKETAICMIADGVEAASRTLDDPTPSRIQTMVYRIANNKFLDGQLDDCDLTLRDLNRICEAFSRVLSGMLHGRVAYPEEQTARAIKDKVAGSDSQSQPAQGLPVPASVPHA